MPNDRILSAEGIAEIEAFHKERHCDINRLICSHRALEKELGWIERMNPRWLAELMAYGQHLSECRYGETQTCDCGFGDVLDAAHRAFNKLTTARTPEEGT
jgi:hypothetical protein